MSVRNAAQLFTGQADHLVGDIHTVDLPEMAAERADEPARSAADFEGGPALGPPGQTPQFGFELAYQVGGSGEEFVVILLSASEGHVVVRVFAGAIVPLRAHLLQNVGICHAYPVFYLVMAIAFRQVVCPPLEGLDASAPDGAVIGVIGENGAGKSRLLRLAAGLDQPVAGTIEGPASRRLLGPGDGLNLAPVELLLLDQTLARQDRLVRERAAIALDRLRRAGATVLLVSHEEDLLREWCDEIWWLREGRLAGRGAPAEILEAYRRHIAARLRAWGETVSLPLAPLVRRGDGRTEVLRVDLIGESGQPTMVWRSGELASVRVTVRFHQAVADPVIGILIRSRIGLNVYGTNTELERLKVGPCAAGDTLAVRFAFRCELCPQEYTLTVASHDPDGVWHDWLEDAVAFSVTDTRYTAGVANLRAVATLER